MWGLIVANLLVLVALAFIYPHLMVAPGALMPGHASLNADCFACHAPLRGAQAELCIACHALADIGLRTTKGAPIQTARPDKTTPLKISFHQELAVRDCMACHSDHAGPKLTHHNRKPFSHEMLRVATRERCASCHTAPDNNLHRNVGAGCAQCHTSDAWKPATFEHDRHFVLDKDHNTTCVTCHATDNYKTYTCYGCHEHTPDKIRRKHVKEGIPNFENCVECHRSASEKPERSGTREGGRSRRERD